MCDGGSSYQTYDTADCSNRPTLVEDDGTCLDAPQGTQAVRYLPVSAGSCPVIAGSEPIGSVNPIGEMTICCTP